MHDENGFVKKHITATGRTTHLTPTNGSYIFHEINDGNFADTFESRGGHRGTNTCEPVVVKGGTPWYKGGPQQNLEAEF